MNSEDGFEIQVVNSDMEIVDTLIGAKAKIEKENEKPPELPALILEVKNEGESKEMYDALAKIGDGMYRLEIENVARGNYKLEILDNKAVWTEVENLRDERI